MIDDTRGWLSLFLGLITFAFGFIPLLNHLGIIGFNLPISIAGIVLAVILVLGSIFLFLDATHQDRLRSMSIMLGLVLLVLGGIPLLAAMNVLPNDFTTSIYAIALVRDLILMVTGVMLMLGSGD